MDTVTDIAKMLHTKWQLGLEGTVLIANPVPVTQEIAAGEMEAHIKAALEAANIQHISGKEVTPFLLQYIANHTKGESLEANIALIKHNALVGSQIAVAYGQLS